MAEVEIKSGYGDAGKVAVRPYYQDDAVTIYHGDARQLAGSLPAATIITDPVWPNATAFPEILQPKKLFYQVLCAAEEIPRKRLAVHLGCDSDPRFLDAVLTMDFVRVCWLEVARGNFPTLIQ